MKILIAEDNNFYRTMLQTTISGWGYEVVGVENGLDAWQQLQQRQPPEIAILDWMMPGLSGLEVCRKVRMLRKANPTYVIMLTAKEGKANTITALQGGADDYISKPVDFQELHARLQVGERIVGLQTSLASRVSSLENALSEVQRVESLGRLASGVAHDFNNLLTIINGYSELLLEALGPSNQMARDLVEVIVQAGQRGTELTKQLLAFARKQVLSKHPMILNDCVGKVEKMMRHLLKTDVHLETVLDPELVLVEADGPQIEQVLLNLILNARDAMPSGGRITITTRNVCIQEEESRPQEVPPGTYAVMAVTDTGTGMDEPTRTRVFEPFFTTKGPGKGTGLGLASAYGIIRQSEGFITIDSQLGHGSAFKVYLPQVQQTVAVNKAPEPPVSIDGRETVLLVEDEQMVRTLARNVLSKSGYQVLEAADGDEALKVACGHSGPIHLLLTDVVMPGMTGCQLATQFSPMRPAAKILFMSGHPADAVLGTNAPFLAKPFTIATIQAKIREILGQIAVG